MGSINIVVSVDNVSQDTNASQISDMISNIVERLTGNDASVTIYDNDGTSTSNPIYSYGSFKKAGKF